MLVIGFKNGRKGEGEIEEESGRKKPPFFLSPSEE